MGRLRLYDRTGIKYDGSQVGFGMDWAGYCMVCLEKLKLVFMVLSGMGEIALWCPF